MPFGNSIIRKKLIRILDDLYYQRISPEIAYDEIMKIIKKGHKKQSKGQKEGTDREVRNGLLRDCKSRIYA